MACSNQPDAAVRTPRRRGYVKGTHMTQKRLLALLGAFAIMASACGGSSATQAPAESQAPGESPAASGGESPAASADLAAEQTIRWPLIQDPATLDPNLAQDSQSTAVLVAVQRGLTYGQGPEDRSRAR